MISFILLVQFCFLLLASAFFSGAEMGLYALNRVRLRIRAGQETDPHYENARVLLYLENHRQQAVLGVLLWQNVAAYLLTVVASEWLARVAHLAPQGVEFYSAVILSPLVFVLGDVTPKNWFRLEADRLMYALARPLYSAVAVLRYTGILWPIERLSRTIARMTGEEPRRDWLGGRGEVLGLFREGAAGGSLTEEQTQIIERVLNLSKVSVRTVMIPRPRVITVPYNITRAQFEAILRGHSFSRMPVLGPDGRTVVGTVSVQQALAFHQQSDLASIMRPPLFISAGQSATSALIQLQQSNSKMAIVTHPRHGFVGIVTLKDLVEEIFGELPAW